MGKEHLKSASTFEGTSDEMKGFLLALCAWREAKPGEHPQLVRMGHHEFFA